VTLSNAVKFSSVVDCDFWRTGDSAVIAVGSTKLTNATASEFPQMNVIERNYFDTVGGACEQCEVTLLRVSFCIGSSMPLSSEFHSCPV
jgi:hypothetical protein